MHYLLIFNELIECVNILLIFQMDNYGELIISFENIPKNFENSFSLLNLQLQNHFEWFERDIANSSR